MATLYQLTTAKNVMHSTDIVLLARLCIALGLKKTAVIVSPYDGDLKIFLERKSA